MAVAPHVKRRMKITDIFEIPEIDRKKVSKEDLPDLDKLFNFYDEKSKKIAKKEVLNG